MAPAVKDALTPGLHLFGDCAEGDRAWDRILERPLLQASHVARVFVFSIATSASGKIR